MKQQSPTNFAVSSSAVNAGCVAIEALPLRGAHCSIAPRPPSKRQSQPELKQPEEATWPSETFMRTIGDGDPSDKQTVFSFFLGSCLHLRSGIIQKRVEEVQRTVAMPLRKAPARLQELKVSRELAQHGTCAPGWHLKA